MSRLVKCPFLFRAARRVFSVSAAEKPKRTTKKVFSELPKVHLLPDGTPAPSLPEWHSSGMSRRAFLLILLILLAIVDLSSKHVQESKRKRVRKSPSGIVARVDSLPT